MTPSASSFRSGHRPQTAQRALIQAAVISAPVSMAGAGGVQAAAPRASSSHWRRIRQVLIAPSLKSPACGKSFMVVIPLAAEARRGKTAVARGAGRVMRGGCEHADFLGLVDFPQASPPLGRASSLTPIAARVG